MLHLSSLFSFFFLLPNGSLHWIICLQLLVLVLINHHQVFVDHFHESSAGFLQSSPTYFVQNIPITCPNRVDLLSLCPDTDTHSSISDECDTPSCLNYKQTFQRYCRSKEQRHKYTVTVVVTSENTRYLWIFLHWWKLNVSSHCCFLHQLMNV